MNPRGLCFMVKPVNVLCCAVRVLSFLDKSPLDCKCISKLVLLNEHWLVRVENDDGSQVLEIMAGDKM